MTDKPTVMQADIDAMKSILWVETAIDDQNRIAEVFAAHREAAIKEAVSKCIELTEERYISRPDNDHELGQAEAVLAVLSDLRVFLASAKGQADECDQATHNAALEAENVRLQYVVEKCRAQFSFYADEHRKAGKDEKAATNQAFADICAEALKQQGAE